MAKYQDQGCKTRNLDSSVKSAPADQCGGAKVLAEAKKGTTGIIGMSGVKTPKGSK
jgi:hypothetical protein